ncbi:MAG TPA: hypothetical protein VK629_13550 [Steroidobacteraceae bacterium]|nr:hypothetical protein [Steroidobacteraceae bacterium]
MNYYLMWGEHSPLGGLGSGMRFVRHGEPNTRNRYDPRCGDSIIVYA